MYDIAVIGAGITGSAIARELSKYNLKTVVIEKGLEVCQGTTKANSAIVHGGFDAKEGSLKAKLNVEGNSLYKDLILNTRFLYAADESKFFILKDIDRLIIKTDGFVKIEVASKEYDVYTQVYTEGKFIGFELLRVSSVEFIIIQLWHWLF